MKVINDLLGYDNMKIYQDNEMFNFSLDSVLLPNFVTLNKNVTRILDVGCGNAPISLILSTKTNAKITGIEIQKNVFELALESVKINSLENKIDIINTDINEWYKKQESDIFDCIVSNPPYFKIDKTSNLNKSDYKTIARHEVTLNLEQLLQVSKKLLKNNGVLALVYRPERLIEIINLMQKYNVEPKKMQLVYPKKEKEANVLLIEGVKNGKPGLKILPPIYTHNEDGSYTDEIQKIFERK